MSTDINFKDGSLFVTRTFDAPREEVFDAWIATAKVEKWWGCGDTTNVKSDIDPKVGGKYFHLMTIKDTHEAPVDGTFIEFDPPKRLAYQTPGMAPNSLMTVSVDFIEHGDKTEVRLVHANLPTEIVQFVRPGWTAAFEKLGKFVEGESKAA